jgi:V/A-type H+/Na+-transporting ATPase subunit D
VAISFQYNKTALQTLDKQLKVRERALPTLKNKESALRVEVKKAKDKASELAVQYDEQIALYDNIARLWGEFDQNLIRISDVELSSKKLQGFLHRYSTIFILKPIPPIFLINRYGSQKALLL